MEPSQPNPDRSFRSLLSYRRSRLPSRHHSPERTDPHIEPTPEKIGSSRSHPLSVDQDGSETPALNANSECRPFLGPPVNSITPLEIASAFAKEATCVLSAEEVDMLIQFLEAPERMCPNSPNVDARLETFYREEMALTQEPQDRLSSPSGPEHAEIGIVLHCQSKEGQIGEFWDRESQTIGLLEDKGFSPEFVHGFDWHWRGEESARRIESLSLPWLVVGGSCPKMSNRRMLPSSQRLLLVNIATDVNIEFEIDIRDTGVKRITLYIPHPVCAFFHPSHAAIYSAILDASLSFILWVHGREDAPNSFAHATAKSLRGIPGAAPLEELYDYRKRETALGRQLNLSEYDHSFRIWARKFLPEQPEANLSRGSSLAEAIIKKIGETIRASKAARRSKGLRTTGLDKAGRNGMASRYGNVFRPFWEGEQVRVTQKGEFKIFLSENEASLELCGGAPVYKAVQGSSAPVIIHFLSNVVLLKQGGVVLFQKTLPSIQDESQRTRWERQLQMESDRNADTESANLAAGEGLLFLCADLEAEMDSDATD